MITPFYQAVIAIGAVLLVYVFISEKLWRKENWFDDTPAEDWSWSLWEGTLSLYKGNRIVATLSQVYTDEGAERLVEELIHDYETRNGK